MERQRLGTASKRTLSVPSFSLARSLAAVGRKSDPLSLSLKEKIGFLISLFNKYRDAKALAEKIAKKAAEDAKK